MTIDTFVGADGNTYQAGGFITVTTGRSCFGSACYSGSQMQFQHKDYPGIYDVEATGNGMAINGGQINFPDYEPTTQTQSEINAQKQHFQQAMNEMLDRHNYLVREINNHSEACANLCSSNICYNNCLEKYAGGYITEYEINLADMDDWNTTFSHYVGALGEEMIANCIPCDQIKTFLIDQFGDVLKSNFMTTCEEIASETNCEETQPVDTRTPTICCITACCYPEEYILVEE